MARYIVTSRSHFQPFTYNELAAPLQQMTDVHNATQDVYDQIGMETDALDGYINADTDPYSRSLYDDYRNKLKTLQDNLWNYGLTSQTRRNLHDARVGYAQNIDRLQKAIKRRQENSKAYWDTAHKDPSNIMGIDPGLSSLDNYVRDENYGSNWFSYNGDQFMKEVAADAQARAAELQNIRYEKGVPGYITQIVEHGFTGKQANDAVNAVRNGTVDDISDEGTKLLAQVFQSHLDSTGAKVGENISQEQFNRFYDYGLDGFSSVIGKTQVQNLRDELWHNQNNINQARRIAKETAQKPPKPVTIDQNIQLIDHSETPGFSRMSRRYRRRGGKAYENNQTYTYSTPDNTSLTSASPWDVNSDVFNSDARHDARAFFDGFDVADPKFEQTINLTTTDGRSIEFVTKRLKNEDADRLGIPHGGVAVVRKDTKQLYDTATRQLNSYIAEHRAHVDNMKAINPNVDFDKIGINEKEEARFRKEHNIDPHIDSDFVGPLVAAMEGVRDYSAPDLVGVGKEDDGKRENFTRAMVTSMQDAERLGFTGKNSRFAIYTVGNGGETESATGESDMNKIFTGDSKTAASAQYLQRIQFRPEEVARGAGNGRIKFRFSTSGDPKHMRTADAILLGTGVENALIGDVYGGLAGTRYAAYPEASRIHSRADAVQFLMKPILDPQGTLLMDDASASLWSNLMFELLNNTSAPIVSPNGPVVRSGNSIYPVDARAVALSKQYRDVLYKAVGEYIDNAILNATLE